MSYPLPEYLLEHESANFLKFQKKDSWILSRKHTQRIVHCVYIPRYLRDKHMHKNSNEPVTYFVAIWDDPNRPEEVTEDVPQESGAEVPQGSDADIPEQPEASKEEQIAIEAAESASSSESKKAKAAAAQKARKDKADSLRTKRVSQPTRQTRGSARLVETEQEQSFGTIGTRSNLPKTEGNTRGS